MPTNKNVEAFQTMEKIIENNNQVDEEKIFRFKIKNIKKFSKKIGEDLPEHNDTKPTEREYFWIRGSLIHDDWMLKLNKPSVSGTSKLPLIDCYLLPPGKVNKNCSCFYCAEGL